jgi:RNA methyltransferase, TrmH family
MITSTANSHVKYIRSLRADQKQRRSERMFVLEGLRLVADALAAGATFELVLFASEQLARSPEGTALLAELAGQPGSYEASSQAVAAAADTVTPQGIVAVARWPELAPRSGLRLVLDGIQDPGNVGTLLRSAEAAGVGEVLCSQGCADAYSPKVVRAAMGAHFTLPLRIDQQWDEIAVALAELPLVYAAVADARMPYYAADWRQPAALIIGSEAHGVSEAGLNASSHQISIPMQGRSESLNAAVAGSVILFEALRQRTRGRS